MPQTQNTMSTRQALFREMIFGTLVYAVVLGFFVDYTAILDTTSYSTTFLVALVMQLLTYLTLLVKKTIVSRYQHTSRNDNKVGMVFSVWLVLFLSKFVFLAAIDVLFGESVYISGFVGLMAIIITMTITKELIDYLFDQLADESSTTQSPSQR